MMDSSGLFRRGDRVRVAEQGIRTWEGRIVTAKPSSVSGWWYEVQRDDGVTFAVPEELVESEEARR